MPEALNRDYEEISPEQLARIFLEREANACLTCSFQAEDIVVLNIARQVRADIPVLFLDTGYHFEATYRYRDLIASRWDLNLVNLKASRSVAEQEAEFGILNRTDPVRCCHLRKVEPLMNGLAGYDVWFTGLRREQSPTRRSLKKVERHRVSASHELWKVSPLADWTWSQVWAYLHKHNIDYLPLYDAGYTSIGCEPCTSLPVANDLRSGRWGGKHLECGIHTFSSNVEQANQKAEQSPAPVNDGSGVAATQAS